MQRWDSHRASIECDCSEAQRGLNTAGGRVRLAGVHVLVGDDVGKGELRSGIGGIDDDGTRKAN